MTESGPIASTPPSSNSESKAEGNNLCAVPSKVKDHSNIHSSNTVGDAGTEPTNSTPPSEPTPDTISNGIKANDFSPHSNARSKEAEANRENSKIEATPENQKIDSRVQKTGTAQENPQDKETADPQEKLLAQEAVKAQVKQEAQKQNQTLQTRGNEKQKVKEKKSNTSARSSDVSPASTVSDDSNVSSNSATSDTLDFAKRDISKCTSRHSYSQLSSLTVDSPGHHIEPLSTITDEPVLQADDHERIRNPASAAFQRIPDGEQIGFREPFGNGSNTNSRVGSSASSPEAAASPGTTGGSGGSNVASPHSKVPNAHNSPNTMAPFVPSRRKPYEPARVVLHKSEFNAPYGAPSAANSGTVQPNNSAYPGYIDASRRSSSVVSDMPLVPHSLVLSLAESPDDTNNNGPLKHIREPKQPIYIPAVLRPTEETSYETGSPHGGSSGRTSISTASLASSAWAALHSQKPVTRHWVRDESASQCGVCERSFTWYRRKHHCRKCGGIFCATDTSRTIGLDRILNFNVLGVPCRACDKCASEFASFCLDSPRLSDGPLTMQQPMQGPEQEEIEAGGGGDWSTF